MGGGRKMSMKCASSGRRGERRIWDVVGVGWGDKTSMGCCKGGRA